MLTNHEAQSLVNAAYEQAYADVMTKVANGDGAKEEGFFKKTGQKIKGGYNKYVNKIPYAEKMGKGKHAVVPVLLAAGAGGAYAYNRSRKKKASAWDYDPYLMEKYALMDDYGNEISDKAYNAITDDYGNRQIKVSKSVGSNTKAKPKGGSTGGAEPKAGWGQKAKNVFAYPGKMIGKTPWIGAKLGRGAHAVLPVALAAGGGAYAYHKNKKKKEASLFGDALYDLNYQIAFAEEVEAWKQANGLV